MSTTTNGIARHYDALTADELFGALLGSLSDPVERERLLAAGRGRTTLTVGATFTRSIALFDVLLISRAEQLAAGAVVLAAEGKAAAVAAWVFDLKRRAEALFLEALGAPGGLAEIAGALPGSDVLELAAARSGKVMPAADVMLGWVREWNDQSGGLATAEDAAADLRATFDRLVTELEGRG